jgi:hypothetical protein
MKKIFCQADLSGWLSPDEERLLNLYRDASEEERSSWLYRITRRRLAHMFAVDFDDECDAQDTTYLYEELEQWLQAICPKHLLGEYLSEEPHFETLVDTAWGSTARVLLGPVDHDGQRADDLFNAAVRLWDMIGRSPGSRSPLTLDRKTALTFLETWRETALQYAYRGNEQEQKTPD